MRGSLQGSTPLVPVEFGIRYKGSPLATWVISMSMSSQVGKFVGGLKCCPHVRCRCLQCGSWRRHPRLKQVCVTPTLPLSLCHLQSPVPAPRQDAFVRNVNWALLWNPVNFPGEQGCLVQRLSAWVITPTSLHPPPQKHTLSARLNPQSLNCSRGVIFHHLPFAKQSSGFKRASKGRHFENEGCPEFRGGACPHPNP